MPPHPPTHLPLHNHPIQPTTPITQQNALDVEMEERRKRVEEWRKKRAAEAAAAAAAEQERKQQEEAAAAAAAAAAVEAEGGANGGKKGWSLEDDEDDDEPQQQPEGVSAVGGAEWCDVRASCWECRNMWGSRVASQLAVLLLDSRAAVAHGLLHTHQQLGQ